VNESLLKEKKEILLLEEYFLEPNNGYLENLKGILILKYETNFDNFSTFPCLKFVLLKKHNRNKVKFLS